MEGSSTVWLLSTGVNVYRLSLNNHGDLSATRYPQALASLITRSIHSLPVAAIEMPYYSINRQHCKNWGVMFTPAWSDHHSYMWSLHGSDGQK